MLYIIHLEPKNINFTKNCITGFECTYRSTYVSKDKLNSDCKFEVRAIYIQCKHSCNMSSSTVYALNAPHIDPQFLRVHRRQSLMHCHVHLESLYSRLLNCVSITLNSYTLVGFNNTLILNLLKNREQKQNILLVTIGWKQNSNSISYTNKDCLREGK